MKPASRIDPEHLQRYIDSCRPEFEERLAQIVEIPTVSMDPEHKPDMERGAALAAQWIRDAGGRADVVATPGYPVVVGAIGSGARRTLTIYNHLDVQPAHMADGWQRPPFTFFKRDGRYEGRGTTDDKGPALTALMAVRYAAQIGIPLNVRFLWELEEEIGSPNFEMFLKPRAKTLATDSVLVSDTIWIARGKPAVSIGLRGLQTMVLRLETGTRDTHSGLAGGAMRNPLTELAALVGECFDPRTGRVKIKGFYDDVEKASKAEIVSFLRSGFNVAAFKKAHGIRRLTSDDRRKVVEAIWARPSFEVHGVSGGYNDKPGVKTAIPPRAELKVSVRLVPNQSPAKILRLVREFVQARNPDVQVVHEAALAPYKGQFEGPYTKAASEAMRWAFGKKPALVREGGSIGAVVTMQKHLRAPVTFIGLSLPEHGYHAPNENYDWEQGSGGIKAFVRFFELVSAI